MLKPKYDNNQAKRNKLYSIDDVGKIDENILPPLALACMIRAGTRAGKPDNLLGGRWNCTREKNHAGSHVAHQSSGLVMHVWNNADPIDIDELNLLIKILEL